MEEKKTLMNYLLYILVFIGICFVGITGVFADTTIDTSSWINVTGIKFSETGLFYTGNPQFNNDWLLNNYYVYSGTFVGTEWNYVEFSYFEHSGGTFNPCNSTSKFTANFSLLFTSPGIVDQVISVKWNDDNCAMTYKNSQTGIIDLSCGASPTNSNSTGIYINYSDSIFQQNQSYVYISRNLDLTCGLNTDAIINNDNANTQNIINNNNQNTQQIIDSSASNTQALIDSNRACYSIKYDINNSTLHGYLSNQGAVVDSDNWRITNWIDIKEGDKLVVTSATTNSIASGCFYTSSKSLISCKSLTQLPLGEITVPSNAKYFRGSIQVTTEKPVYAIERCTNGQQAVTDSITGLDDTINDSDIDNSDAVDFFSNFNDNTHGLSGIISAPLVAINSMLDNQCTPQTATWKGQTISIDCGYDFWNRLSTFKQFLNVALDGLICYRILVKLFKLIESIKNPEDDRVEVMDL